MAGLHGEVRAHGLSPAIPEGKLQMGSMQANVAYGCVLHGSTWPAQR